MSDFGWAFVKSGLLTSSAPPDKSVQFNNGGSNLGGSPDFTYDTTNKVLNLTGTMDVSGTINVSGNLNVSGAISANQYNIDVINKTVTNINTDGSTKFGDSSGDTHQFTGSIHATTITSSFISASSVQATHGTFASGSLTVGAVSISNNAISGITSISVAGGGSPFSFNNIQAGTAATSSFLALNASNNLVLTSSSPGGGSGGTIGAAEDGSYADGLFSDFTTNTTIGTAIDKFNEILKIIVPGPAPAVDRINYINTVGDGLKLSIRDSSKPGDYTAVGNTGSFSDSLVINSQYPVESSGEDFRLGVYNGLQEITGVINFHVTEQLKGSEVNYSNNSFGNAESGSLKLFINGALRHTLNLTASGTGNPNTGSASDLNLSGSGFFNLSITASAKDQNASAYDIFQHRTSRYVVDPNDQRKGWNIAKVEHQYGSSTYITNFVQWFNDTDANSNAMAVVNPRITVAGEGSKYLSGVKYFTAATGTYNADVTNVYKHTYPTGNVLSFTQTNMNPASATSLPAIGGGENFNKILEITQSSTNSTATMLGTTFVRAINLTHPLKVDLSGTGSATSGKTLIYNVSNASSNLLEKFDDESFRLPSGSYDTQGPVGSSTWSSGSHMTGSGLSGHTDGLMFFNSNLVSPKNTSGTSVTNGNFSALTDGPAGNPNYSTLSGTRTFYRKVQNTTGGTVRDLKITTEKDGTKISAESTALAADNVKFFVKLPGSSGYMNISENFAYGTIADGSGALVNGASDNSSTATSATGDSVHCVTFGTASIADDEYIVVKIIADDDWTGQIENITFKFPASDVSAPTEADALDDIDLDDTAGETARLSFGTSNGISGYTNVAGGVGSMAAVNSNAAYTDNSDTNRGVFKALEVMGGTLNEDVVSDGQNHPANSFKNAYTGSLLLVVNDSTASTLSLANLNATNNLSSNTGFSVGAVDFSKTTDLIPDYTKPYRTGTYSIGTSIQRSGWNYARVVHKIGAAETTTNYVQWVVDPSGSTDNTTAGDAIISNFGHTSIYYQSGIRYFAANPTGSFFFTGSNFYSNVHSNEAAAISFPTTTNATITNIRATGSGITTYDASGASAAMPALNNSADCELTNITITGSVQYSGASTSISGGLGVFTHANVSVSGRILHPLKTDRTTGTRTKNAFMRYSGSIGSTTLTNNEYFNTEDYRIVSGNYANQAALSSSSNTWNPQTHMNAANAHGDGLVSAAGYLISPFQIGNDGDTRNTVDGGSLQAPGGNPDYSTLSTSTRTYYRLFRYTGVSTVAAPTLTLYGDATLVSKDDTSSYYAALGNNKRCTVELKVGFDPNFSGADDKSTAWTDTAKIIDGGENINIDDGAGVRTGAGSGEDVTIDGGGLALSLSLGAYRIQQNQYFVVKISADKDWTGYISRIQVAY